MTDEDNLLRSWVRRISREAENGRFPMLLEDMRPDGLSTEAYLRCANDCASMADDARYNEKSHADVRRAEFWYKARDFLVRKANS
jgi:hypothetical protein